MNAFTTLNALMVMDPLFEFHHLGFLINTDALSQIFKACSGSL